MDDIPAHTQFWRYIDPPGLRGQVLRDLALFLAILVWSATGHLLARDLIWGLWISSLTVGYATIVLAPVGAFVQAKAAVMRVGLAIGGLFMIAFFTVHFGGFHFVHAVFLSGFFPIPDLGEPGPAHVAAAIPHCLLTYWPMILASGWMTLGTWRKLFTGGPRMGGGVMMKPYANVIRMHLLIFVFAGFKAAGLDGIIIYPVLLFYFFPWSSFFKWLFKTEEKRRAKLEAVEAERSRLLKSGHNDS